MSLYLYGAGGILIGLYAYFSQGPRSKLPLPPGPRKWPVVGNLFDMPSTFEWITFMEWSKKYGGLGLFLGLLQTNTIFIDSDVLHLNVAGTSIIVLSSAEAANDLLEKKANIYSDRWGVPVVCFLILTVS